MSERQKIRTSEVDDLLVVLSRLDDPDTIFALLEDMFTVREIRDSSQRLAVARMLSEGRSYSAIEEATGASATTIARVSKCLMYGAGGYAAALEVLSAPNRKFSTFIFDLDGTLLDTLPDLILLANWILQQVGYPQRSEAEIKSFVGNGVRRLIYQAVPEDAPEEKVEQAMHLWNTHFHEYYKNTFPYAGIVGLLEELHARGCKVGVVSNKLQPGVDQVLDACLPGFVDVRFGEGPGIPRKPDPTGIERAINELGGTLENTVYIGDSPGDIRAARNAHVFSVGVTWGYHEAGDFAAEDADPDWLIDHPDQLLEIAK